MDRADRLGLGAAATAHLVLLAALSLGLLARPVPLPKVTESMDVQLTDAVGLRSTAPVVATEPPAASVAPAVGAPQDAAPPEPVPAPVAPAPTPPAPAPKPTPAPPAPAPKPSPTPKPTPAPVADSPKPAKTPPKAAAASSPRLSADLLKSVASAARSEGAQGRAQRAQGARLGSNFLKGVVDSGEGKGDAPRAALGAAAMNGLGAAIKRQVQPCYERKPLVGPGGERIRTVLRLRFKPDGSLAARPTMSEQGGLDDENGRYARRAAEVAIAAVMECTPLKLPAELYKGGWEDIEPTFSQRAQ